MILSSIKSLDPADLEGAIYDFILKYAYPAFEADSSGNYPIYEAHQNRMSLPSDSEDIAVYQVLNQLRVGTNIERIKADDDAESYIYLVEKQVSSDVQISFYSTDETARLRAEGIELICYGGHADAFFKEYGISCSYAEQAQEMTVFGSTNQYVERWNVTIRLTYYAPYEVAYDYAEAVSVSFGEVTRLEDTN